MCVEIAAATRASPDECLDETWRQRERKLQRAEDNHSFSPDECPDDNLVLLLPAS
jgi:hypothetical protein